jgi:hypothetical protein
MQYGWQKIEGLVSHRSADRKRSLAQRLKSAMTLLGSQSQQTINK